MVYLIKLKHIVYKIRGLDTVEANHQLGFKEDERTYETVSGMIKFLAIKKIDLMTNNPKENKSFKRHGYRVKSENISFHQIQINITKSIFLQNK